MTTRLQRLWLGTGGDVTCDEHAGVYLKAEIANNPSATMHTTPLDWWIIYSTGSFPCETCHPWRNIKVGA